MSSTKSATGHVLGAAGAHRGDLRDQVGHSTRSCRRRSISTSRDEGCDIDLRAEAGHKQRKVRFALGDSFGFGGTNAALIVGPV